MNFYFRSSVSVDSLSHVPHVFLDPDFSLKKAETFSKIFPFLFQSKDSSLSSVIETHGKPTHEKLAHHLDSVEVNIADQVAQKSHHFFEVMTYHDALMQQLKTLLSQVQKIRCRLQQVDQVVIKGIFFFEFMPRMKTSKNLFSRKNFNIFRSKDL